MQSFTTSRDTKFTGAALGVISSVLKSKSELFDLNLHTSINESAYLGNIKLREKSISTS